MKKGKRQNRPSKSSSNLAWVLIALGALVMGALYYYVSNNKLIPEEMRREPAVKVKEKPPEKTSAEPTKKIEVLKPKYTNGNLSFEKASKSVPTNKDPYLLAINTFLEDSKLTPKGAKARTAKLDNDTLTIDFTPEFETTYGTEDENTLLSGIIQSLKQFPDVKYVKLKVAGHDLETLGSIDLTEPQPINP